MAKHDFIRIDADVFAFYRSVQWEGRDPITLPFMARLGHRNQREIQLWNSVSALRSAVSAIEQSAGEDDALSAGLDALKTHVGRYVLAAYTANAWIARVAKDTERCDAATRMANDLIDRLMGDPRRVDLKTAHGTRDQHA